MDNVSAIKGVLFDLDGVLFVGNSQIAGAAEAVSAIRNSGIACRFVTNNCLSSRLSRCFNFKGPTALGGVSA